jgi:hypothetical protein
MGLTGCPAGSRSDDHPAGVDWNREAIPWPSLVVVTADLTCANPGHALEALEMLAAYIIMALSFFFQ